MTSRYDPYWRERSEDLSRLFAAALRTGQSQVLDVGALRQFGERQSWYGHVEVQCGEIVKPSIEAHVVSLAKVLCGISAIDVYHHIRFRVTISKDCRLRAEVVSSSMDNVAKRAPMGPQPHMKAGDTSEVRPRVQPADEPAGQSRGSLLSEKPTALILFPCSGSKRPPTIPLVPSGRARFVLNDLHRTCTALEQGRQGLADRVQWASPCSAALDCYAGHTYEVPGFREAVLHAQRRGLAEFGILSGAYGLVYPEEFIHNYDVQMDAVYWRRHGLPEIIAEWVEATGVSRVYGFCATTTDYAKVLKSVNWSALSRTTDLQSAALFWPICGGGSGAQRKVPTALGEAILAFLKSELDLKAVQAGSWQGLEMGMETLLG